MPIISFDDALRSGDVLIRLRARALGAVIAIVPADVATIVSVSRRGTLSDAIVLRSPRAAIAVDDAWRLWMSGAADLGPFMLAAGEDSNASVLMLADVRRKTPPAYFELLDAIGAHDAAAVYLRVSGTVVAIVALLRSAGGPSFASAEAVALRRVHPLLEHAHACAAQPGNELARCGLIDHGLTAREVDVAALIGKGATNAQIARSLHLSEATVKTHLSHIYAKLEVSTRTELAILVRDRGQHRGRFDRSSVEASTTFG